MTISLKKTKKRKERAQPNANQHLQQRNRARSLSFPQSYSNNFPPGLLWSATRAAVFLPESTKSLEIQGFQHIRTKHRSGLLKKMIQDPVTLRGSRWISVIPSRASFPACLFEREISHHQHHHHRFPPELHQEGEKTHKKAGNDSDLGVRVPAWSPRHKKKERRGLVFKTASCSELPQLPGDLINTLCTS